MKLEENWQLFFGIFVGFVIAMAVSSCIRTADKAKTKATEAPKTIQWIGKLAAGDGNAAVFMCREIEIGLGEKGELVWRTVNAPPMPLKSTATNAEAK